MKKFLAIVLGVVAFATVASAQPRAIGIRAGYGGELSYQHTVQYDNFLEADLGFVGSGHGVYLTGIYDFVFASVDYFNFYAGPGIQMGMYSYDGVQTFNAGIAGQVGAEFVIPNVPINLSLDWRPVLYLGKGGFGWQGLAIGIRYRFQ